jgi:Transposase DNA-binding/Transposase Tn5 dimerisation domain
METSGWAAQELRTMSLGDPRREARVVTLLDQLSQQPEASIPQAMGTWAATKAAYRCLDNDHTDPDAILAGHRDATRARAEGEPVLLALQDTTQLSYGTHDALAGRGPLARPGQQGVLLHTTLLTTDDGLPLGVLDHHLWARDPAAGSTPPRRQRSTAEKESQRWLDGAARTWDRTAGLGATVVGICDREGDIFDLFAQARPDWGQLLVRSIHERKLTEGMGHLLETVTAAPVLGQLVVEVGRRGDRPPRTATLDLQAVAVTLAPPRKHRGDGVPVTVVRATEVRDAPEPDADPPIAWMLTTTGPEATLDAARTAVRRYARRWQIERYHYVLKQGCAVEALQLAAVDRLARALAVYAIVAWQLLWLTYVGRRHPDQPCTAVLTTREWLVLWQRVERDRPLPPAPPTMAEAVRLIARLGGFLARRHDGDPGVKTIWRGWRRLQDIMAGVTLATATMPSRLVGNA